MEIQTIDTRWDLMSFAAALLLHSPLFWIKVEAHPHPNLPSVPRLVAIDLITPVIPPKKAASPIQQLKMFTPKTPPAVATPRKFEFSKIMVKEPVRIPAIRSIETRINVSAPSLPISTAPEIKTAPSKSIFMISGPLEGRAIEHQMLPDYPEWAQAEGIEASVVLEFTVDAGGFVKNTIRVKRTSGHVRLDKTAIEALLQWKFAALAAGKIQDQVGLVTFNYTLK